MAVSPWTVRSRLAAARQAFPVSYRAAGGPQLDGPAAAAARRQGPEEPAGPSPHLAARSSRAGRRRTGRPGRTRSPERRSRTQGKPRSGTASAREPAWLPPQGGPNCRRPGAFTAARAPPAPCWGPSWARDGEGWGPARAHGPPSSRTARLHSGWWPWAGKAGTPTRAAERNNDTPPFLLGDRRTEGRRSTLAKMTGCRYSAPRG
jgi:hypothetical protein